MNNTSNSRRRGFTLIEVMLVMVILVILASFAVIAYGPIQKQANVKKTQIQIGAFKGMIGKYSLDVGYPPSTSQGLGALLSPPSDLPNPAKWDGPYIDTAIPLDAWDRPYQYAAPGRVNTDTFDVWSLGPDGQDNTPDDIGNWQSQ